MMNRRRLASRMASWASSLCVALALAPIPVTAQTYPDKPVKVIIPFGPGTSSDAVMRPLAEKLSKKWGQPVIIENRPGANTWIGLDAVRRSPADGYTLLVIDAAPFVVQPHAFKRLPFEVSDFEPVAPLYWAHFFYAVPADSKWTSMSDLIGAAKVKPGEVSYGSWGLGSVAHLAGTVIESNANARMVHVPYKDSLALYTGVANGDLAWALASPATAGPLERAKKIKFLAIASSKRYPSYPNVPTVSEAGGTSAMEIQTWVAMFAPRGTPKVIIDRINADVASIVADADTRERMTPVGLEPWVGTPADIAKVIESESKRFGAIIRSLNIKLD